MLKVLFLYETFHSNEIVVEKIIKGGKASVSVKKGGGRGKGGVACRIREGNGIASREREEEAWGKGTFEMHVMLRLGKGGEEWVKMGLAHIGRRLEGEKTRVGKTVMSVGRAECQNKTKRSKS